MRTRQTQRKIVSLPGRYSTGLGEPQDVTLLDLSTGGCRFEKGEHRISLGAPMQIYIADTGPHRAIVKWVFEGEVGLHFLVSLTEEQLDRFQGSHCPEESYDPPADAFEDISDLRPQRFC